MSTAANASNPCWGVLIGRFQPLHHGHLCMIERVLGECDGLIMLFGSSYAAPSLRNPWSLAEREDMLAAAVGADEMSRIRCAGIADVYYSDQQWVTAVQRAVDNAAPADADIRLYGHTKDASSYYLALFPGWEYVELENFGGLSATPLREALLACEPGHVGQCLDTVLRDKLPAGVCDWLRHYATGAGFARMHAEADAVHRFQQAWESSPYPPVFVTVDALVRWQDEVLLIRRGRAPGRGLLAMPGGFVDPGERLAVACLRELEEETGLKLPVGCKPLMQFMADHPERSDRGRMISQVSLFELPADTPRPVVQGADDAASAGWLRIDALDSAEFFEDHHAIIRQLIPQTPAPGTVGVSA